MSSVWFDTGNSRQADAAWELYHENSKQGRRFGLAARAVVPVTVPGKGRTAPALDAVALPPAAPLTIRLGESVAGRPADGEESLRLAALSAVLGVACRPFGDDDPIAFHLYAEGVEALANGLHRYDPLSRSLLLLRRGDLQGSLSGTIAGWQPRRTQVTVFAIGELERAAAARGERGYRDALVSAGRHALALRLAAHAAGLSIREVADFHDRDVDTLLGLDGLAESTLWIATLTATADG